MRIFFTKFMAIWTLFCLTPFVSMAQETDDNLFVQKAVFYYSNLKDGEINDHTPTRVVRSYYDIEGKLVREINSDIMLADAIETVVEEKIGEEVPRDYTQYHYNESGDLEKITARKHGFYDVFERSWLEATDEGFFKYTDGKCVSKPEGNYTLLITWEGENIVREVATYAKRTGNYAVGTWAYSIVYSDFVEGMINKPRVAWKSDRYNKHYVEYTYDEHGNLLTTTEYKGVNVKTDDENNIISIEKGELYSRIENRYENHFGIWIMMDTETGYWNRTTQEIEPSIKTVSTVDNDTVIRQSYAYSTVSQQWIINTSLSKVVYGELNSLSTPDDLKVTVVENALNTAKLMAAVPQNSNADNSLPWDVYRNGMLIGQAKHSGNILEYEDKQVKNGTWEYFLKRGEENISNIVEIKFETELAAPINLKVLSNGQNSSGDYEVIIGWTAPNSDIELLGYNVYTDVSSLSVNPIPYNEAELIKGTSYKLVWNAESDMDHKVYVEAVYPIGRKATEVMELTLSNEVIISKPAHKTGVYTYSGLLSGNGELTLDNVLEKKEDLFYNTDGLLVRSVTSIQADDGWTPENYTLYQYNELGKQIGIQVSSYDVAQQKWQPFVETSVSEYDEEGHLLTELIDGLYYEYTYEGDNVVKDKCIDTATGEIVYLTTYTGFLSGMTNAPQAGLRSVLNTEDVVNQRYILYGYDVTNKRKNEAYTYHFNETSIVKDEDGYIISAMPSVAEYHETWTYEGNDLSLYQKETWDGSINAFVPYEQTTYARVEEGRMISGQIYEENAWMQNTSPVLYLTKEYEDGVCSNLRASGYEAGDNQVILQADLTDTVEGAIWNVYRNGIKLGEASLNDNTLMYTDSNVPYGKWEYFIQADFGDKSMTAYISEPFAIEVVRQLPPDVCLQTDFTEGIPSDFTLIDYDQIPVDISGFNSKFIVPAMTWFASTVNSDDKKAALSTSYRAYDIPTDNWMITPQLTIPNKENICLKWTSRSIHYYKRDGYRVMISTKSNTLEDFVEVYALEEEDYEWTHHTIPLADYAGKQIYIAFVHDSQKQYMLALDDMYIGEVQSPELQAINDTRFFAAKNEKVDVKGVIVNKGKDLRIKHLECVTNKGKVLTIDYGKTLNMGDSCNYLFEGLPLSLGESTIYTIEAVADNNKRYTVMQDSVICSYYRRTLLLEKGTGTWCTSCPQMNPLVNKIRSRYGDEMVYIEVHSGDNLSNGYYSTGMGLANLPTLVFNRDNDTRQEDCLSWNQLRKSVTKETYGQISLAVELAEGNNINVSTTSEFARQIDNSADKYRVGFTILEKKIESDSKTLQRSGVITSEVYEEYYFLPSPITADLMYFSNVARTNNSAFTGYAGSIPALIEEGKAYTFNTSLQIPEWVIDRNNLSVVAFLFNNVTGELVNVAQFDVPESASSLESFISDDSTPYVYSMGGGTYHISCVNDAPFTIQLYSPSGQLLRSFEASSNGVYDLSGELQKGVYILRIVQDEHMWSVKITL